MRSFLPFAALFLILCIPPSLAPAAAGVGEWDVDKILAQDYPTEFRVSPDGRRAVFVKRFRDEEGKAYRWHLFLAPLDAEGGPAEARQLTRGEASCRGPRWSPDGRRLAFLGEVAGKGEAAEARTQIRLLDMAGGEAETLTELEGGVAAFRWLDAERLIFLTGEGKTLRETRQEEAGDQGVVVGDADHVPPMRLFTLSLAKREIRRVTSNERPILSFEPSPDGRWVVGQVSEDLHFDYDFRHPPRVLLWDLKQGGEPREVLPPEILAEGFVWDRKSEGFAFAWAESSDSTDRFVSVQRLGYRKIGGDAWEPVDLEWEQGLAYAPILASEDGFLVSLYEGARNRLMQVERKGRDKWKRRLFKEADRGTIQLLDLGADGKTVLFARSTASVPPRYLAARLHGDKFDDEREFVAINAFLRQLPLPRTEIIHWIGARGDEVEGILHYPLDYRGGEPHPLVVMVHGGPMDLDRDAFQESWGGSPALFASRGAFVLRANYHGSAGYGLEWLESIKGRYYELELPDILSGVDSLVAAGLVDESRLGIQGWSNGAILAIATCIESGRRFRALDAGAGDVDWISDFGNCEFGAGFEYAYFGGPPWKIPQVYVDKSPLFRAEELQVPTLIFFGSEDRTVPSEQGWELYRALQQIGEVPVRFVLFPGEEHTLMSPPHRRRQLEEEMVWFDRYLFETHIPENESFKEGSPLDRALRLADAASVDGLYGEQVDSLLIPELLDLDSLLVGRFELTLAQWATYQGLPLAPEEAARTGNLPVTGLGFEAAAQYCIWLSEQTGLSCRLPRAGELATLRDSSEGEENTLAWWAGYTPTPDDARRLLGKLELLEANRSLLMPVGSFGPAGKSGLYDLGGNAAEWVSRDEGGGRAEGLSAVTWKDPRAETQAPPLAYLGFRVVAERSATSDDEDDR